MTTDTVQTTQPITTTPSSRASQRRTRLASANAFLEVMATTGRRFFSYNDRVSTLELDERQRVWFVDAYNQQRTYTHYRGRWSHFSQGGTMRSLTEALRDFVLTGELLDAGYFGPWPSYVCGGDLWGYGAEAMEIVRAKAREIGIVAPAPTAS